MRIRSEPSRTTPWQAFYRCLGRESGAQPDCRMPGIPREYVDPFVFAYFEAAALDLDGTLAEANRVTDHELAAIEAQAEQAKREWARAGNRLDHVRRDYQDEKLVADDWNEQREQLQKELTDFSRTIERLLQRRDEILAERSQLDSEQTGLEALAQIRAAVAGGVSDADSVVAARAALAVTFEHFVLHVPDLGTLDGDEAELRFRRVLDSRLAFNNPDGETTHCLEPVAREDAALAPWRLDVEGNVIEREELARTPISSGLKPDRSGP
jgi:hypothetical protein